MINFSSCNLMEMNEKLTFNVTNVRKFYAKLFRSAILMLVLCFSYGREERSLYLVLMEGEPLEFINGREHVTSSETKLERATLRYDDDYLVKCHLDFIQSTLEAGSYNKVYSFVNIINGFAIHTTPSQAKKLEAAGAKMVVKDRGVRMMTTYTPEFMKIPESIWAMKGGDEEAGEGIVIGVIDTGINPSHPSFSSDLLYPSKINISNFNGTCETGPRFPASSCNGKIISARFFSAGAQAVAKLNKSIDYLSPYDAIGHGSHVASIAAGNHGVPVVVDGFFYGRASGMAPAARIAVYKAVYPSVGTLTDLIAAIDQAVKDGVDMLVLSVGPDSAPENGPVFPDAYEVALLNARRAGIFVAEAVGNDGPTPASVVSYSPWTVGVASCNTDRIYPNTLHLGNGLQVGGVGLSDGLLPYKKIVFAQDAARVGGKFLGPEDVEECQHGEEFDPMVVADCIVICTFSTGFQNGTSSIASIVSTVLSLKVAGFVLIANSKYGDLIAEPIPYVIPGILIPKVDDAKIIKEYYKKEIKRDKSGRIDQFCGTAAIGEGRVPSFEERAPIVSRLSSRGPALIGVGLAPADVLKPDIMAPGHQIWAAWSPDSAMEPLLSDQEFALLSGTSMAAPHIVGIAALIKQQNPSWTPSMIASAISTSAIRYDNIGEVIHSESYDPNKLTTSSYFDSGAGLVNPSLAVDPGLVFPTEFNDYMKFLCSLPNVSKTTEKSATGTDGCSERFSHPAELNLPSITVSELRGTLIIQRRVYSVGTDTETYMSSVVSPDGTAVNLSPAIFTVELHGIQDLCIECRVKQVKTAFTFGEIILTGSVGHIIRIPLSLLAVSLT